MWTICSQLALGGCSVHLVCDHVCPVGSAEMVRRKSTGLTSQQRSKYFEHSIYACQTENPFGTHENVLDVLRMRKVCSRNHVRRENYKTIVRVAHLKSSSLSNLMESTFHVC